MTDPHKMGAMFAYANEPRISPYHWWQFKKRFQWLQGYDQAVQLMLEAETVENEEEKGE